MWSKWENCIELAYGYNMAIMHKDYGGKEHKLEKKEARKPCVADKCAHAKQYDSLPRGRLMNCGAKYRASSRWAWALLLEYLTISFSLSRLLLLGQSENNSFFFLEADCYVASSQNLKFMIV